MCSNWNKNIDKNIRDKFSSGNSDYHITRPNLGNRTWNSVLPCTQGTGKMNNTNEYMLYSLYQQNSSFSSPTNHNSGSTSAMVYCHPFSNNLSK